MKTYKLINDFAITTTFFILEKPRTVRFTGGSRSAKTKGFFKTDDRRLQMAIELSKGYNVNYTCRDELGRDLATDWKNETGHIEVVKKEETEQTVGTNQKKAKKAEKAEKIEEPKEEKEPAKKAGETKSEETSQEQNKYLQYIEKDTHPIYVEEVTNRSMAIAWLQAKHGKTFEETKVKDMRIEGASKYGVIFPNWN